MKKLFLIALCAFFFVEMQAQSTTDEIQLIQSQYGMDKKQLIVAHMKFSDAESKAFWPIYDKYEADRRALGRVRVDNIMEFSKNYSNLTNEKATELITTALNNHKDFTKLQEKTFKELSGAITALRAAQFIQLEVFLESVVRKEIATAIPLIEKVEATEKK